MKNELRIEYPNKKILNELIDKAYFKKGQKGRLDGKKHYIEIDPKKDDVNYVILSGLNNIIIKVYNIDVMEGNCQFIVDESNKKIKLYPVSIFCIIDNDKYSFY